MTFETFYTELISEERWYEYVTMRTKGKNFKAAAEFVYGQLLSDPILERRPMTENRKHVYNKLVNMPYDKVAPALQQEAKQEVDKEWKPASPEHVDKCVAEFDEMIKNSPMLNYYPRIGYKQAVEEGGWLPKKDAPYPVTSVEEAYIKDRHIEYIKQNYEARTGEPLPGWIDEKEFNIQFDNGLL